MTVNERHPVFANWPSSFAWLDRAEHLILWSFHRWVLGLNENTAQHWSLVWNEFGREFGARQGRTALTGFASLVRALQCHARRNIRYHRPCCPCLGADELWLLSFVAACQRRDHTRARAVAEWKVRDQGIGDLLDAGARFARSMSDHALILTLRDDTQGDEQPVPINQNEPDVTRH